MKAGLVALFLVVSSGLAEADVLPVDKRDKEAWFCKKKDCPSFKTVREEAEYSLRRYDRTTWAISCAFDAYMPDSVLRATARVLNYVKENDLWGATPLASVVHLSFGNQEAWTAWNASTNAEAVLSGQAKLPEDGDLGLGWAPKTICAAYFLPNKYQADMPRNEVDRRPPRPSRRSGVKIVRIRGFEAFVSGFHGFPTPPRFIWESMRLVHNLKWHREEFSWGTAAFFVYDGPAEVEGRWNEVLIPRRRSHDELFAKMAEEDEEE